MRETAEERSERLLKSIQEQKIGLDEPFKFNCTMCGKCCINREDIMLNPQDLFRAAKELGMTPFEFQQQYCECYIGGTSRMPIIRLKPVGPTLRCPLLKGNRCAIHKSKPFVCAAFPIGRFMSAEKQEDGNIGEVSEKIGYVFTDPHCGDKRKTHTVREWLASFGLSVEDEFYPSWTKTLLELSSFAREREKKTPESLMELLWKSFHVALYLDYDIEKDFYPQYLANVEKLNHLLEPLKKSMEEQE